MDKFRPAGVIFDMDGLLVDSEPLWGQVLTRFAERRGGGFNREDAAHCLGKGIPKCVEYLRSRYSFEITIEAGLLEILTDFRAHAADCAALPGAETLVAGLRGQLPVALASSSDRETISAALSQRGWLEGFDAVVGGDEVEHLKPAPDIFLLAAERLGLPATECVIFEDSPAGCIAARAAGAKVVAIPAEENAARPEYAANAHWICSSLLELPGELALPPPGAHRFRWLG